MPWRNEDELKQENQSGDILFNIKKHEPYFDIDMKNCKTSIFFKQMKKKIMQNFQ